MWQLARICPLEDLVKYHEGSDTSNAATICSVTKLVTGLSETTSVIRLTERKNTQRTVIAAQHHVGSEERFWQLSDLHTLFHQGAIDILEDALDGLNGTNDLTELESLSLNW